MSPDVIGVLSVGVATGALFVAGMYALRDVLLAKARNPPGRRGGSSARAGTGGREDDPPTELAGGRRTGSPDQGGADRSLPEERHDAPRAPGSAYDPRPQESKARRTITYLLIALLAFTVVALLAMVAFGLISVAEAKEFNVIVATLVPLVSAAIVYYFGSKGGGDE